MLPTCSSSCHLPLDISWRLHSCKLLFFFQFSFFKQQQSLYLFSNINIHISWNIYIYIYTHMPSVFIKRRLTPIQALITTWLTSTGSQPRSNGETPICLDHLFGMDFCKSPKSLNAPMTPNFLSNILVVNSSLLPNHIWYHKLCLFLWWKKTRIFKQTNSLSTATPGSYKRSTFFFPHSAREPLRKSATSCWAAPTITWEGLRENSMNLVVVDQ